MSHPLISLSLGALPLSLTVISVSTGQDEGHLGGWFLARIEPALVSSSGLKKITKIPI